MKNREAGTYVDRNCEKNANNMLLEGVQHGISTTSRSVRRPFWQGLLAQHGRSSGGRLSCTFLELRVAIHGGHLALSSVWNAEGTTRTHRKAKAQRAIKTSNRHRRQTDRRTNARPITRQDRKDESKRQDKARRKMARQHKPRRHTATKGQDRTRQTQPGNGTIRRTWTYTDGPTQTDKTNKKTRKTTSRHQTKTHGTNESKHASRKGQVCPRYPTRCSKIRRE
jgi:hypothetical protein